MVDCGVIWWITSSCSWIFESRCCPISIAPPQEYWPWDSHCCASNIDRDHMFVLEDKQFLFMKGRRPLSLVYSRKWIVSFHSPVGDKMLRSSFSLHDRAKQKFSDCRGNVLRHVPMWSHMNICICTDKRFHSPSKKRLKLTNIFKIQIKRDLGFVCFGLFWVSESGLCHIKSCH